MNYKLRSPWQSAEISKPEPGIAITIAARQALDDLLAMQLRLELATGVPVAIYGSTGQVLPGISPVQPKLVGMPAARDLLAPRSWPRRRGLVFEVTHGSNLRYFITPLLLGDRPIAQFILGPIQIFEPGTQNNDTNGHKPASKITETLGIPVLPFWRAQAIAELASLMVSALTIPRPDPTQRIIEQDSLQALSDEATRIIPIVGGAQRRPKELSARLGSLAEDVNLPPRPITGTLPQYPDSGPMPHVVESAQVLEHPEERGILPVPAQSLSLEGRRAVNSEMQTGWLHDLIEGMPQAVIVSAAPDGQIVLANRAARELWPELLGGQAPVALNAERYPPEWSGLSLALRQDAALFRSEVSLETSGGGSPLTLSSGSGPLPAQRALLQESAARKAGARTLLVSAFTLRGAQGATSHAVAIFEELNTLIERELFKDELLLVAAHDMRNPLTVISSYAQLLGRHLAMEVPYTQGSERVRGRLTEIQEQVQLLTDLSNQLSTITRLQSARQRPRRETINLARLLQRMVVDQQVLTPGRTIESMVEHDPCLVQGDQEQFQQILMHLLKNAVRYSHPEKPVRLSLRCTPENTPLWAEICVRDQGIGIPRASLPHIFERFYRVGDNEQRARAAGLPPPKGESLTLGLGLYLCKQLVEHIGGRIWIDSVEGLGTTVSFTVPLKR